MLRAEGGVKERPRRTLRPRRDEEVRRSIGVGCRGAPELSRTFLAAPGEERPADPAAQPVVPGSAFGA